ncbi:MAG: hypothetical protein JST11_31020 [Acidobacteria bacterium]|nr:hypothetical protein [Acidobacteriota bacterium]
MRIATLLLLAALNLVAAVRPDGIFHAVYRGAAADFSTIAVSEHGSPDISLPVTDPAVRAQIKDRFEPGDRLTVTFNGGVVQQVDPETVPITITDRLLVLAGFAAVQLAFGLVVLRGSFKRLVIGEDNRYSNSKCQMGLWFSVLALTYLAATFLRWSASGYSEMFAGGVNLPQNLLVLSGLSVFSFGAAKGITSVKQSQAAAAAAGGAPPAPGAAPPPAVKTPAARPQLLRDLLCDDNGNPDLGDYQMLAVTVIAVSVYVVRIFGFLGSIHLLQHVTVPDVDTTILATFGLGQGAYLAKKQLSN